MQMRYNKNRLSEVWQRPMEDAWDGCLQVFLEHFASRGMILSVKCSKHQYEHKRGSMF